MATARISVNIPCYNQGHFLEDALRSVPTDIGTASGVIFRKKLLPDRALSNNPRFRGCEDYDLYLTLARNHPLIHEPLPSAVYRRHSGNISNDRAMMLNAALHVLLKHKTFLGTQAEKKAWKNGWNN